jgi:hypothetical protein
VPSEQEHDRDAWGTSFSPRAGLPQAQRWAVTERRRWATGVLAPPCQASRRRGRAHRNARARVERPAVVTDDDVRSLAITAGSEREPIVGRRAPNSSEAVARAAFAETTPLTTRTQQSRQPRRAASRRCFVVDICGLSIARGPGWVVSRCAAAFAARRPERLRPGSCARRSGRPLRARAAPRSGSPPPPGARHRGSRHQRRR